MAKGFSTLSSSRGIDQTIEKEITFEGSTPIGSFKFLTLQLIVDNMSEEHRLKVGEKIRIGSPVWHFYDIAYAGMPNAETFSLAILEFTGEGYGYNLYFPKGTKEINLFRKTIKILDIAPDEIRLQYNP